MKKIIMCLLMLCLCSVHIFASDSEDSLDEAFKIYLQDPYYDMTGLEEDVDSIYDLRISRRYVSEEGNLFFTAMPHILNVSPMLIEYEVGEEVFAFNNIGYWPYYLVFDGNKVYHIAQAYNEGILNDWELREYALMRGFRDATYADLKKEEWYFKIVEKAIYKQLMGSTGKKTEHGNLCFEPDQFISRGMVATVLMRMSNKSNIEYESIFEDVKPNLWYSNAVVWAAKNDLVQGYDNGLFGVDDCIIRQDLAIMLRNYAKMNGLNTSVEADLTDFLDNQYVDTYASSALAWCVEIGLMSGQKTDEGNLLNPKNNATRAECAKMFSLLDDVIKANSNG